MKKSHMYALLFTIVFITTCVCLVLIFSDNEEPKNITLEEWQSEMRKELGLPEPATPIEPETQSITIPCTIETETLQLDFRWSKLSSVLEANNRGGFRNTLVCAEDEVYIDLCIDIKNLGTTDFSIDNSLYGRIVYDGKYEYTGLFAIEDDYGLQLFPTYLQPLKTATYRVIETLPIESKDSEKIIEVYLTIDNIEYYARIR